MYFFVVLSTGCMRANPGLRDLASNSSAPVPMSPSPTPEPSPTPTPKVTYPKNGENLSPRGKGGGPHELLIDNNSGYDAIAKLTDVSSGRTYRHIFIRKDKTFTIRGIRNGTFELKFALGAGYSPDTKGFLNSASFSKFDAPMTFQTRYVPGGYYTDSNRITLGKVAYGNASTSSISSDDFADR